MYVLLVVVLVASATADFILSHAERRTHSANILSHAVRRTHSRAVKARYPGTGCICSIGSLEHTSHMVQSWDKSLSLSNDFQ